MEVQHINQQLTSCHPKIRSSGVISTNLNWLDYLLKKNAARAAD